MILLDPVRNKKSIALFTAFLFMTSLFGIPPASLFAAVNQKSNSGKILSISNGLGSIEIYPAAQNNRPYIFFIQDAHANYEAQSRIRDILKELAPQLKTKMILLEGASHAVQPEVFQFTDSLELNKQIAGRLAQKGFLTGAELFSLEPESKNISFLGMEDESLYQEEREAFMSAIRLKPETDHAISVLDSRLEGLKARIFSSRLKELDRKFTVYEKGKLPLLQWFDSLRKLVEQELGYSLNDPRQSGRFPDLVRLAISYEASQRIDSKRLEDEKKTLIGKYDLRAESENFVVGLGSGKENSNAYQNESAAYEFYSESERLQLNWLEFPEIRKSVITLLLSGELEGQALFREMENLKDMLYDRLSRTPKEKQAIRLDHDLRLLKDLLSLESTRETWEKTKNQSAGLGPQEWLTEFKKLEPNSNGMDPKRMAQAESAFQYAVKFYELAEARERVFMNRIQESLSSGKEASVIAVGGGFHTDGLKESALKNNFNFAVIQPRLEKGSNPALYYQAVFESNSLPFLASKMSPALWGDPEQPGNDRLRAQILVDVLNEEKLAGKISLETLNRNSIIQSANAEVSVVRGRFVLTEIEAASARSLGNDDLHWRKIEEFIGELKKDYQLDIFLSKLAEDDTVTNEKLRAQGKPVSIHGSLPNPRFILAAFAQPVDILEALVYDEKKLYLNDSQKEVWEKVQRRVIEFARENFSDIWSGIVLKHQRASAEAKVAAESQAAVQPETVPVAPGTPVAEKAKDIPSGRYPLPGNELRQKTAEVNQSVGVSTAASVSPAQQEVAYDLSNDLRGQIVTLSNGAVLDFKDAQNVTLKGKLILEPKAKLTVRFTSFKENPSAALLSVENVKVIGSNTFALGEESKVVIQSIAVIEDLVLTVLTRRTVLIENQAYVKGFATLNPLANPADEAETLFAPGLKVPVRIAATLPNLIIGAGQSEIARGEIISPNVAGSPQPSPSASAPNVGSDSSLNIPAITNVALPNGNSPQPPPQAKAQSLGQGAPAVTLPVNRLGNNSAPTNPILTPAPLVQQPVFPNRVNAPLPNATNNFPQNLGTNSIVPSSNVPSNRVFDTPKSDLPSTSFSTPNRPTLPVNVPRIPGVGQIPGLGGFGNDQSGSFQDFLKFVVTARAAVAPKGLPKRKEEQLVEEISGESALLRPLVAEGILTPLQAYSPKELASWEGALAKLPEGPNRAFLEAMVHKIRSHRVAVTVGVSDPSGLYSLNNPDFRDSILFHLENNPNAVFRFVHLGSPEEARKIQEQFTRFSSEFNKRFKVVPATSEDWDTKLRGLLGEELLVTVQKLPAGLEVRSLDALYKGKHIAVVLPKTLWLSNPKLPNASIVKVTSLAEDSKISSQAARNQKWVADVAFLETSLSQLASLFKGSFKDLLQVMPEELFNYSEGRFSLNTERLIAGLLEDIHEQALTLQKLAYQA